MNTADAKQDTGTPDTQYLRDYGDDPWRLNIAGLDTENVNLNETLFSLSNGFLGMRGNFTESLPVGSHGTFLNGLHETWKIEHAENAYGFAETGQTIVNVPDSKTIRLYVDDERLNLLTAEIFDASQQLDMRDGVLRRSFVWRTPSGKHVTVEMRRMVSFTHRHIATTEYTVSVDRDAELTLSSLIVNRQDLGRTGTEQDAAATDVVDSSGSTPQAESRLVDPRKSEQFSSRVLQHERSVDEGTRSVRAYRTSSSRMGVVVGVDHQLDTPDHVAWDHEVQESNDRVRHLFQGRLTAHTSVRLVKTSAYDFSGSSGADELVDRCVQQLNQQQRRSETERWVEQRAFLDDFWRRSYLEVGGVPPQTQQAINWNLFQLAQSSARADGRGIPAKGLTGSGYSGHYFWDSEVYVSPFLVFTSPQWARNALRFRASLLPSARRRAAQMNEEGALFAWRTINGEEASAYYAAGTAQYHINADITYALTRYVRATGDAEFVAGSAGDVAIETARMWMSLGFWRTEADGSEAFHIHGVTGPDEYTTVVNDNLYTNVMARYNLRSAIDLLDFLKHNDPDHGLQKMVERLHITDEEIEQWRRAEHGMSVPYDEDEHIHPQDAHFLEREVWDLEATPPEQKPLLLHFHPLVIYRFQVLKQADVVLAMLLASQDFTEEEKQRNFEYYDQLTTGDSSLSAVVQSIIAAEVGYRTAAFEYFEQALRVDLDDLHSNTGDGVHIASAGGVWLCLVQGFAGMRDVGGNLRFDPRLPEEWTSLSFTMKWRGSRICVELTQSELAFTHVKGAAEVPIQVRGVEHVLHPAGELRVELKDQGPNLGELKRAIGATQDHGYADDGEYEYITTEIPTIEFWEA